MGGELRFREIDCNPAESAKTLAVFVRNNNLGGFEYNIAGNGQNLT